LKEKLGRKRKNGSGKKEVAMAAKNVMNMGCEKTASGLYKRAKSTTTSFTDGKRLEKRGRKGVT